MIKYITSKNYKKSQNLNLPSILQKSRITDSDLKAAKIRSDEVITYFIKNGKLPITR